MKHSFTYLAAVFLSILGLNVSCNNSLSVNAKAKTNQQALSSYDADLLNSTYESCIYVMKLAEESNLRSTLVETKTFAESIVADYKKIMEQIEEVAGKRGVELPLDMRDRQLKKWRSMVKETGLEFDKKFIELVIEEGNITQKLAKSMALEAQDNDVRKTGGNIVNYTNQQQQALEAQQLVKSRKDKDSLHAAVVIEP